MPTDSLVAPSSSPLSFLTKDPSLFVGKRPRFPPAL